MINYQQTILSQYSNSQTIKSLIENYNINIDPRIDIDEFYKNIWDINTAKGIGLDIWGKIVNIERKFKLYSTPTSFGFFEAYYQPTDTSPKPFNQAPLFSEIIDTDWYVLSDDAYRIVILIKALSNISLNTIENYNTLLRQYFEGRGICYVIDNLDMTINYLFKFELNDFDLSILTDSRIIPRPAGVDVIIKVELPTEDED